MNLPALEVPQLVISASIVSQHDRVGVPSTSECSSSASSLKYDSNDVISITIQRRRLGKRT